MNRDIPIQAKKDFIQMILKQYELKNLASKWILEYVLVNDHLLVNSHFVKDASHCPRGIMISTTCSPRVGFRFHKKHVVTFDVDKAFHDLRFNKDEPMYWQINFHQAEKNPQYIAILADNPYAPEYKTLQKQDEIIANHLLTKIMFEERESVLKKQIDRSLDEHDRNKFYQLTNELKQLYELYKG